jgi:Ran GTPase-activating protein 1
MSTKILSLQGKGLKLDSRADIEPWIRDVDPSILEEVHFGGNTIGVDAAKALAEFLEKTAVLKIADFADIFTGRLISEIPLALSAICDALKDKTSLIEINLSDNAFGGRSVDPMVPFLTQNRSFQILKLNNNGLGPAGGAVIAGALLESAQLSKSQGKKSNLRTLICGRNRLEDGSASAWADAFAAHETLLDVRMPQNGIRMDGIVALARGLAKNPGLQHLDLQDNTFTDKGTKAWAEALPALPELHTLNVSDCHLCDVGVVPLMIKVLASGSNPKLHTLQLQNNNLEEQTFALIAKHISTSLMGLKSLELQWNEAEDDDEHLEAIGDSMKLRGGRLFVLDDDEEEDVEEEAEEDVLSESIKTEKKDSTADALADLLNKAHIG